MPRPLKDLIFKNIATVFIANLWGTALNFFLTPFIIYQLGVERYAIWIVLTVITGYIGLSDFGLGNCIVKFIAESHSSGKEEDCNKIINVGIVVNTMMGIFFIALTWLFVHQIVGFFNVSSKLQTDAVFVFKTGVILFVISNILGVFGSYLSGRQLFHIVKKIDIALGFINFLSIVLFLYFGFGLAGLVYSRCLILILRTIFTFKYFYKYYSSYNFKAYYFDAQTFKKLFNFGAYLQISQISQLINQYLDKTLLGHFISLSSITFYDIGSRLNNLVKRFLLIFIAPLIPAASEMNSLKDTNRIWRLYEEGTRYLSIATFGLFGYMYIAAPFIIRAWVGSQFDNSVLIVRILCVGFCANILTGMISGISLGIGRPDFEARIGIISTVLNLVLSFIFILRFGFKGAAFGTSLAMLLASCYYYFIFYSTFQKPFVDFLRLVMKPFLSVFITIVSLVFIINVCNICPANTRFFNSFLSFVLLIVFMILYLSITIITKTADKKDMLFFVDRIKALRKV